MRVACSRTQGQTAFARRWPAPVTGLYHFTDRKSTRLNSSHLVISYAVFCLKKKKKKKTTKYTNVPLSSKNNHIIQEELQARIVGTKYKRRRTRGQYKHVCDQYVQVAQRLAV